jgi:hypothetical protein
LIGAGSSGDVWETSVQMPMNKANPSTGGSTARTIGRSASRWARRRASLAARRFGSNASSSAAARWMHLRSQEDGSA